jgi:hypothetical protein
MTDICLAYAGRNAASCLHALWACEEVSGIGLSRPIAVDWQGGEYMALDLIDRNAVHLIGENSILRLQSKADGPNLTLCSFWRSLYSPAGPGHVLFVQSELFAEGVRIFSDNPALARWFQALEALMRKQFTDSAVPVEAASFSRVQDGTRVYSETAKTGSGEIVLEWRDLGTPFMTRLEPNNAFVGIWSVFSCLVPASEASLAAFGKRAAGRAFPDSLEGQATSTSFLALGEVWLHPAADASGRPLREG